MNKRETREMLIEAVRYDINEKDTYPKRPKELKRLCPRVFEMYFGRKYLLPQYRQGDYFRQEFLNYCEWANVQYYPFADPKDEVVRAAFVTSVVSLTHKRPQLFLERELGEALIRTELPMDMIAEDIKWKWPGMRVYLPKGLLTVNIEGYEHSMMFLDIALLATNDWYQVPYEFAQEFDNYINEVHPDLVSTIPLHTELRFAYPERAFVMSGMIEKGPNNTGLTTYSMVKPFAHYTLDYLSKMSDSLKSEWKCDTVDDAFIRKSETIAINVLLFLSAYPLEYPPDHLNTLRKPRLQGKEHLPGLYPAKFVGQSQIRPENKHHNVANMVTTEEWHRYHQKAHFRCGHWRRTHFGPKRGQSRLTWISPYAAGREEEENEKKV